MSVRMTVVTVNDGIFAVDDVERWEVEDGVLFIEDEESTYFFPIRNVIRYVETLNYKKPSQDNVSTT